MYMIEITEDRLSGMEGHIEKALLHLGKVMQCISEVSDEDEYSDIESTTSHRNTRNHSRYSQY